MTKYTVTCTCKRKRTYEAQTLGECMKLAEADGWISTGEGTRKACRKCAERGEANVAIQN